MAEVQKAPGIKQVALEIALAKRSSAAKFEVRSVSFQCPWLVGGVWNMTGGE